MPLDKTSMATKVKAKIAAVPPQQGPGDPSAYRDAIIEAMCAGIIEEITTNAVVPVTTGSSTGTYNVT